MSDLEGFERQITDLQERIAHCKAHIAHCDTQAGELNAQIDKIEASLDGLEKLPVQRVEVRNAMATHRTKLEKLQAQLTDVLSNRSRNVRIQEHSATVLSELPWTDIKNLRAERKMLESL